MSNNIFKCVILHEYVINTLLYFITDGVVVLDSAHLRNGKIFGHLVCSFRYGRKEDEVMGLCFQKDMYLASEQIYPALDIGEPVKLTTAQVNIPRLSN